MTFLKATALFKGDPAERIYISLDKLVLFQEVVKGDYAEGTKTLIHLSSERAWAVKETVKELLKQLRLEE